MKPTKRKRRNGLSKNARKKLKRAIVASAEKTVSELLALLEKK